MLHVECNEPARLLMTQDWPICRMSPTRMDASTPASSSTSDSLGSPEVDSCRPRTLIEKLELERLLSGLEPVVMDGWYEADSRMRCSLERAGIAWVCICDSKSAFRIVEHVDVSRALFALSTDQMRHESPWPVRWIRMWGNADETS